DAGDARAPDPREQDDALARRAPDRAEDLEEAAQSACGPGAETRPEEEHDADAEDEQGCGPHRNPADRPRRHDQRSEDERARSADGSGDASGAPEPVVSGKCAREQPEPDRTTEVCGRNGVDQRADRVAGGDLSETGATPASPEPDAPAGRRCDEAEGEQGRRGDDPPGLSTGQVAESAAERPSPQAGHADRDARGQKEPGADRVFAAHRPELTEPKLVEQAAPCVLTDHVIHAIGMK